MSQIFLYKKNQNYKFKTFIITKFKSSNGNVHSNIFRDNVDLTT